MGGIAGCGGGENISHHAPLAEGQSRLVVVRNPHIAGETGNPDAAQIDKTLDAGMRALSGQNSVESSWKMFFSPGDKVGIKPNLLGGPRISTSTALLFACINRLRAIGIREDDIIVWAPKKEHFEQNGLPFRPDGPGVRFATIEDHLSAPLTNGSFSGRVTTFITEEVDAILNLCVIKDHRNAGVTLSMKNHFGSIDNPADHHANHCDPAIADLNALPALREKARLFIADGSRGCFDNGPYFSYQGFFAYNGLLLSNDPVALDYQGWQIIESRRREAGLPALREVGREPTYIYSAHDRGLGHFESGEVDLVVIEMQ